MIAVALLVLVSAKSTIGQAQDFADAGQLDIVGRPGYHGSFCPLTHTSVNGNVAGFGARVDVVQTFTNPSTTPIEAIYTFPLPHDSAVDRMRIKIGNRVIEGTVERREEARRMYDAAKSVGQTAGLLDQERPNIFTQSIANVMPGATVQVNISYVQVLKYEDGQFEFTYPMVVGPRYLGHTPDPEKVFPSITPPGTRTGQTIDLTVHLDAGATIEGVNSVLHKIDLTHEDEQHLTVSLHKRAEIPNRDFILRYQTATDSVQSAFITSYDAQNGGFFNLILLPPKAPKADDIAPRELNFLVDKSGSQNGFPLAKSKELTYKLLNTMRPGDTFNVFWFNVEVAALWSRPRPFNAENLAEAHHFLDGLQAEGGTELLAALKAVMNEPKDPNRLRIILLNSDGFVGNEPSILPEIKKDRDQTRLFTFGIGNSVNRYLIDAMSVEGKGDSEMVTLADSSEAAADRFAQRLRSPVLTDVQTSAEGIELTDMVPREIPDVFSDRPIVIQGRYENPGQGKLVVSGKVGGKPWSKTLSLNFSPDSGEPCVATLWARKKVDDLYDRSYEQQILPSEGQPIDFRSKITDVALQFGLMTEYTSFVAVAPRIVNIGGVSRTVHVPVDMASGVSYTGIFGIPQSGIYRGQFNPVFGQISNTQSSASSSLSSAAGRGGAGGFGGRGGSFGAGGPGAMGGGSASSSGEAHILRSITVQGNVRSKTPGAPFDDQRLFENVVDKRLRSAKGKVEVMIFLNKADADTIANLKLLGLTIAETDKKMMIVFGACDASALKKLADLREVDRISPLQ